MQTEFDPITHIGRVDGVRWPSVTQLLKEFGIVDFTGVPDSILEKKRILGTRVHAATVLVDNGTLDEEHFNTSFPECIPYLEAYRKFRVIETFEPEHKEHRYFSKKLRFHGAPDESGIHIMKDGSGVLSLIDYKCTFRMYESAGPQLSAYAMLLEECLGIKIKKRLGLLLKGNGSYELCPFRDLNDATDFRACVMLHWRKREHYKTNKEK